jgi:hypothetical protein
MRFAFQLLIGSVAADKYWFGETDFINSFNGDLFRSDPENYDKLAGLVKQKVENIKSDNYDVEKDLLTLADMQTKKVQVPEFIVRYKLADYLTLLKTNRAEEAADVIRTLVDYIKYIQYHDPTALPRNRPDLKTTPQSAKDYLIKGDEELIEFAKAQAATLKNDDSILGWVAT